MARPHLTIARLSCGHEILKPSNLLLIGKHIFCGHYACQDMRVILDIPKNRSRGRAVDSLFTSEQDSLFTVDDSEQDSLF